MQLAPLGLKTPYIKKYAASYLNRSSSGAYRWSNRQEVEISRTVQSSCRAQSIFSIQHTVEWNNYLLRTVKL
ncbi:hypothetical protein BgiMline_024932 [Biomphalaria glabrata]|nr:hypothetical protein BgiMline_008095 [Biomphalaria glabrata]